MMPQWKIPHLWSQAFQIRDIQPVIVILNMMFNSAEKVPIDDTVKMCVLVHFLLLVTEYMK